MRLKLVLICTIAAVLLCLVACASLPKEVSVDESYSGKEVALAVGGSLIVTLDSNATTGFEWELTEISDEAVLGLESSEFQPPEDTGVVGAPGKEIWTFNALKKGESCISMEYSQPWEGGTKAAETFDLTVVVK